MNNSRYTRYYTYIKPALKNKSVRSYGALVFSLITVAFFSIFAIRPTIGTIVSLQKSIKEQEELLTQIKAKIQNLTEARRAYDSIDSSTKTKINDLLPYSTEVPPLIESLLFMADTNDASLSAIQFQPVDIEVNPNKAGKTSETKEVAYAVNIQGGYPNLMNYLIGVSTLSRLVNIDSMTFNKPTDESLILSINAKSYYLKSQ